MDQRGRVHELDRDPGAQRRVPAVGIGAGRHEHQQRPQPLATRGDRRPGVLAQRGAVRAGDLGQAPFEVAHQRRDVRASRLDDRGDRLGARH